MRPALLPHLHRFWRDPRTVQLGFDPAHAVVIEFAEPRHTRMLDLLDGRRTERELLDTCQQRLELDRETTRAVLKALITARLVINAPALLPAELTAAAQERLIPEAVALARQPETTDSPAQTLRRRAAARVLVAGTGQLVGPIAIALVSAGVGHVDPAVNRPPLQAPATRTAGGPAAGRVGVSEPGEFDPPEPDRPALASVGTRAARVAAETGQITATIERLAPGTDLSPVRPARATLVIRVGAPIPTALVTRSGRSSRVTVLTVSTRDAAVVIGPLVRPSQSPCGGCLDLHRQDRDPAWPILAAQLAAGTTGTETCTVTTVLAGAACAVDEALAFLDGRPVRTAGATLEITRPGQARRRSWPPHPRCGCRRDTTG